MIFVLELLVIGGITGVLSGLLGIGGAFIVIPLLTAAGLSFREAAALGLIFVVFTSSSGVLQHLRQGTVIWILGLILMAGSIPSAMIGSHYSTVLPNRVLQFVFAFILLATAVSYLMYKRIGPRTERTDYSQPDDGRNRRYILIRRKQVAGTDLVFPINVFIGLLLGTCLGFLSGLLGIGGGWFLVPLLVLLMDIPIKIAVGTTLLVTVLTSLTAVVAHWGFGNLSFTIAGPLILSGIVGAQVGTVLLLRISNLWAERLLVLLLVIASAYMLGKGVRLL